MNKNIGFIIFCGFIIGFIFGLGIVLLLLIVYGSIGEWVIFVWIIIMILGIVFVYVFIFLSLESLGNEGVVIVVGNILGFFCRDFCLNFFIIVVCFGFIVVLFIVLIFLKNINFFENIEVEWIVFGFIIFCIILFIRGVKFIGKFNLVFIGMIVFIFLFGSVYMLIFVFNFYLF